ncbi:MAG: ABC transporter permease subunit [Clostridiales bacterium]|nr:ABC transporter permease subunit [Clostridiales bacterium]
MMTFGLPRSEKLKKFAGKAATAVIWLLLWQAVCSAVNKEILIVSPLRTAARLAELAGEPGFWSSAAMSMSRILAGYVLGVAAGAALALLTSFIKPLREFFSPAISIIKATPVASFIILALVWLRRGAVPVFTSSLMVLPIIWGNVSEGISKTDKGLLEMSRVFLFSRAKRLTAVYIPSAMPYFSAGCVTSLGLAWKAGIAAEVLSLPALSIGRELYNSKIYIETADLFAWTAVVIIMSMLLELALKRALSGGFRVKGGRGNVGKVRRHKQEL